MPCKHTMKMTLRHIKNTLLNLVATTFIFSSTHNVTITMGSSDLPLSLSLHPHRAFKINELKTEVTNRLAMLEKRVERKSTAS